MYLLRIIIFGLIFFAFLRFCYEVWITPEKF